MSDSMNVVSVGEKSDYPCYFSVTVEGGATNYRTLSSTEEL